VALSQDVLTQHNDVFRTGATLTETILNTSNVRPGAFGKLYSRELDGEIYAQPLYVEGVEIPDSGRRNVVFVATMKNNIYAFDADNDDPRPEAGLLWGPFHLGKPKQGRVDLDGNAPPDGSCRSAGYYGIASTPVIDPSRNWMFLVAKTIDRSGMPHQMLHRIDIRTGAGANPNPGNTPTEITTGPSNHVFPQQLNRAGLLLNNDAVYVAFGGHCDSPVGKMPADSYHGWVFAYDATTLTKRGHSTPLLMRSVAESGNREMGSRPTRRGTCFSRRETKQTLMSQCPYALRLISTP
jgi:hypothetical protein